ncbi:RING finger protein 112-like [Mauremys mutica]|uniref:RING finger protein 112-like n=1 Tax=Mauremys mutica TaxID=74926 RepID=UPI001D16EF11|nr:RING finger protein 112-like [Mauremys mutica]
MDEDFRQYLCDYITSVMRSAGTHVWTDQAGRAMTGARVAARIQDIARDLKTKLYDFSAPMKMAEVFAAMRQELNSRAVEAAKRKYEEFVQEQDRHHHSMIPCLRVKPQEMERRLEGKRWELLRCCRGELRCNDSQKQPVLDELEEELARQRAQFLPAYEQRFKKKAVQLGLCIGAGSLAAVGAGVGAGIGIGVAGAVVAVPKGVAIGVGAGGLSLIGGGLGSGVGALLGRTVARKKTDTNTPGQGDEEEARARGSDQEHLLYGGV